MRNLLFPALCIAFLMACKGDTSQTTETTENVPDAEVNSTQISITGHWINERYLDVLQSSQSPRKAQEACEWCLLDFPASPDLPMLVIVNYHEAVQYPLASSAEHTLTILANGANEPGPKFNSIDTLGPDRIKVGSQTFRRSRCTKEENTYKILEYHLFQGTYDLEEGGTVEFTSNGEVKGLDDFTAYNPIIDYFDMGRDVDQIRLKNSNQTWTDFAFRFKQNKLQILTLECKSRDQFDNCEEVKFGDVQYTLRKRN